MGYEQGIDLVELSKYNGQSELENFKTIFEILAVKAEVYDMPLKVHLGFKEKVVPPIKGKRRTSSIKHL